MPDEFEMRRLRTNVTALAKRADDSGDGCPECAALAAMAEAMLAMTSLDPRAALALADRTLANVTDSLEDC